MEGRKFYIPEWESMKRESMIRGLETAGIHTKTFQGSADEVRRLWRAFCKDKRRVYGDFRIISKVSVEFLYEVCLCVTYRVTKASNGTPLRTK